MSRDGIEHAELAEQMPDLDALRDRLTAVVAREGKTLAALNASLFAGRLSDQVGLRIADARRELAAKVIRQYCIAKSLAVALNPIPVADLLAAGALDAALVMHLGRVYGLPLTKTEAGSLIAVISAQLAALMGAIWGVHLVASALKGLSAGLSTVITAGAQGALAWYATELVGSRRREVPDRRQVLGRQGPQARGHRNRRKPRPRFDPARGARRDLAPIADARCGHLSSRRGYALNPFVLGEIAPAAPTTVAGV